MSTTSIIIPTYNGLELLQACVDSIRTYTQTNYEIIVVDNGSTDGTLHYCMNERIPFVSLPDNRGFPIACNAGLKVASGDELVLLNNDCTVTSNWLSNMLNCLYSAEDIGIVGPTTNYASGKQQVDLVFETMEEFQWIAYDLNQPDPSKWQQIDRLVGLCFVFRRSFMDQIGLLDEQFTPGHYEDDDYCYRARLAGYRLIMAGDVIIHHKGSASFRKQAIEEIEKLITINHQKFIDKWGVDPRNFI